jgi:non-heme chloroperoxidase
LALFGAAAPIWTQRKDFPYNLPKKAVDDLIALNYKDRPKLLSDFAKIFSATPTSLNKGIGSWLNGICLSASSYATAKCLIALRDTDLRKDLAKIKIPTLIMHGKLDKICSFDLAEQMKAGISDSQLVPFEKSGHSLFLEETQKFNATLIKFAGKLARLHSFIASCFCSFHPGGPGYLVLTIFWKPKTKSAEARLTVWPGLSNK